MTINQLYQLKFTVKKMNEMMMGSDFNQRKQLIKNFLKLAGVNLDVLNEYAQDFSIDYMRL